jgi:hypothetical protein
MSSVSSLDWGRYSSGPIKVISATTPTAFMRWCFPLFCLWGCELTETESGATLSQLFPPKGVIEMPNIRSAAKRIRSDAKKREKNMAVLSELKSLSKKMNWPILFPK